MKPVREALCGLGLPHTMVNSARGSANRDKMVAWADFDEHLSDFHESSNFDNILVFCITSKKNL